MENNAKTSVLYNATCPVRNFEIQRYAGANGLPIRFDDLNSDARGHWGLDADTAARRLCVLHEGTLTLGIPGLEETAVQVGGRTLLSDFAWRSTFQSALSEPSTQFTLSLEWITGDSV